MDEEGEKRQQPLGLGGVAVDMKSKVWDSESARQGPWEILAPVGFSPLMVLSWHLSVLDPCKDQSGGAWRRSSPTSMPTAVS